MNSSPITPTWSLPRRIAFRFVFAYFMLYIFPFPFNVWPETYKPIDESIRSVAKKYEDLWDLTVFGVGDVVFHTNISVKPNGSGDTTYNYVQVFCYAVLAAAATVLWSTLSTAKHHERLHAALRVYVRFYLAAYVISYGGAKVIKSQFPEPSVDRLMQTIGESSPMGLLWTFMGVSAPFNVFAGAGEMIGGLLLTMRRTTLLGALLLLGVLGHVVALNFCYDVPVKLFSSHMWIMALWLTMPDWPQLARYFLFNRPAEPAPIGPMSRRSWVNYLLIGLRTLVIGWYVWHTLSDAIEQTKYWGDLMTPSPLQGRWKIVEFESDGQSGDSVPSAERWTLVTFNDLHLLSIRFQNEKRDRFYTTESPEGQSLTLMRAGWKTATKSQWTWKRPTNDELLVEGTLEGRTVRAKLQYEPLPKFLLMTRGFHWINEHPYHR